ncbi:MAG TPA: 3-oxoacyl-ACP reductase family protein [Candidatus Limiplasma sp.]|nr:3-oxoacyl-ACP reductase family protein [Candidatus Limiplasma sp.]HPS80998.1 3-oxoacyl-ACP reductase family protein [Candidatus Limiplasma sp.]
MRTVLVTGGSRGIGAACVRAFAQAGWRVAFLYRASQTQAQALVSATGALAVQADVSDSAQVNAACEKALRELRHIDALINNAGVSLVRQLQDTTDEEWRRVLDVNLTGAFYVTRAVLPSMLSAGIGSIVNISSVWGQVGGSTEVAYSAAKAGLIGFTKALAQEIGPSGVTVNAIAPGATRTDMLKQYDEDTLRAIAREAPLGRLCEPMEIARVALWLCSDDAAMMTGQVLGVNGGRVMQ